MTLEAISDTGKIALSADWVELAALVSPRGVASSADLVRSRAAIEEDVHGLVVLPEDETDEDLEEEILDSAAEIWASDVREELASRVAALGASYPFEVVGSGQGWRLSLAAEDTRHDHLLYLCCLLVTARRYGLVLSKISEMDRVLQIVAYLVAGKVVQGDAFWFGYPRPDHSGMEQAVKDLLSRMGFSSPRVAPPMWSVGTENDGGIDVVAWRNFGDNLASRIVLYGQVASGKNWKGKPVTKDSDSTWPHWSATTASGTIYLPCSFRGRSMS